MCLDGALDRLRAHVCLQSVSVPDLRIFFGELADRLTDRIKFQSKHVYFCRTKNKCLACCVCIYLTLTKIIHLTEKTSKNTDSFKCQFLVLYSLI